MGYYQGIGIYMHNKDENTNNQTRVILDSCSETTSHLIRYPECYACLVAGRNFDSQLLTEL